MTGSSVAPPFGSRPPSVRRRPGSGAFSSLLVLRRSFPEAMMPSFGGGVKKGDATHADDRFPGPCVRTRPPGPPLGGGSRRPPGGHRRRHGRRDGRGGGRRSPSGLPLHHVSVRRELCDGGPRPAPRTLRARQAGGPDRPGSGRDRRRMGGAGRCRGGPDHDGARRLDRSRAPRRRARLQGRGPPLAPRQPALLGPCWTRRAASPGPTPTPSSSSTTSGSGSPSSRPLPPIRSPTCRSSSPSRSAGTSW